MKRQDLVIIMSKSIYAQTIKHKGHEEYPEKCKINYKGKEYTLDKSEVILPLTFDSTPRYYDISNSIDKPWRLIGYKSDSYTPSLISNHESFILAEDVCLKKMKNSNYHTIIIQLESENKIIDIFKYDVNEDDIDKIETTFII